MATMGSEDTTEVALPDVEYLVYDDGARITVASTASICHVRNAIDIAHTSDTWQDFIDRIIEFDVDLAERTFGGTDDTAIADYLEGMNANSDDPWPGETALDGGLGTRWPPFDGFDPGDYPCVPPDLWDLYDFGENVYGETLHELPSERLGALLEGLGRLGRTFVVVDSIDVLWDTEMMRISQ